MVTRSGHSLYLRKEMMDQREDTSFAEIGCAITPISDLAVGMAGSIS
jgi:hypothetical protein